MAGDASGAAPAAAGGAAGEAGTAAAGLEICSDSHFQLLAASKTGAEEFRRLLDTHVVSYLQRKRLLEGLKDLVVRVEAAENKLYLSKHLGKAMSKLEAPDQALVDRYDGAELREKIQTLNADIQAIVEDGRLSPEEKPIVLEELHAKRSAAKAAEKAKLLEKVEKMISSFSKGQTIELPLPNLDEVHVHHLQLKEIQRLEKKLAKTLTASERTLLGRKGTIEGTIKAWALSHRMWFEKEFEFQPRLERALEALTKQKAEQLKREAEEALERQREEEERALEEKRAAAALAEERRAQELETRLEVKRLEAALKPQKAAPEKKKKEKAKVTKLDPRELFVLPPQGEDSEEDEPEAQDEQAEPTDSKDGKEGAGGKEAKPKAEAAAPAAEPQKPAPKKAAAPVAEPPKPAPKKAAPKSKPVIESKWQTPAVVPPEFQAVDEQEDASEDALPSLAAAAKASTPSVKKAPPPQPKKKEKKKFTKLAGTELGFDVDNPNFVK